MSPTHSAYLASLQLYSERFWFRCWRRLDLEPVLAVFHSLLTLLVQTVEGQHLDNRCEQ